MVEHGGAVENDLKKNNREHRGPKSGDGGHFDDHADEDFNGMKPQPRGDINVHVGMMHHVQPPDQGYGVEHHMLEVYY